MKKIFIASITMIFFLVFSANSVFAGRGDRHGGYRDGGRGYSKYSGGGPASYKNHGHGYGWNAAAIGLGAGIVGSAIINSYPRERVTVVERNTYYHPAPPPPHYRGDCGCCPNRYDAPRRVWLPGHYIYERGGHYRYIPGRWEASSR
jgi:hypothetical protein